ncbi:MAG: ABC transporter permease [Protaetiibacter sp.]
MTAVAPTAGPVFEARQSSVIRRLLRDPRALTGTALALLVVGLAALGPLLAPYSPTEFVGAPFEPPGAAAPLGTDVLGRDVLSQLLTGGGGFLLQGLFATVLGVGLGAFIGMALGAASGRVGSFLLFLNDSVMVVPQILTVLVLVTAFGATPVTLTVAVGLAQVAFTARLVRAATLRVVHEDYVLAARAVGFRGVRLMVGQLLPNISGPVLVEFGVRLSVSFVVLASLSYLGFGGGGTEWGKMIHDNQGGIAIQPIATLAPVVSIAVFLIGMNLLRDGVARAIAARSAR